MFSTLDWIVVGVYFAFIFGVAILSRLGRKEDSKEYFLAGRNVGWFIVGASIFSSNIGAEHLVGLSGTGAASGLAVAQFEILASLILLLLGWLFVPFYLSSGVFTMPEFLQRRYSAGPRYYLAGMSILGYVLTKISVTIAAGGIVFETLMGIDFWTGAVIVVLATGLYTIWGGLRAVLYTDMIQAFILLGGAVVVTAAGLSAVGGWGNLTAAVGPDFLSVWKPASDPNFPWTGVLFGAPILAVWYWCTDQFIVQRVLSARSIHQARAGTIFAGFLKQTPLFLFVLPGLIAYALMKEGRIELAAADQALPTLVRELLPAGMRGIVAAGLLAALMSSLSSVFNSAATLFTVDVYKRMMPRASERTMVRVGQWSVAALVVLALLWIPFMNILSGQIYTYVQNVQAYVSPPIAAVFLGGVLWGRANSKGAIASLAFGFVFGIGRLVFEITGAALPAAIGWLVTMNFLHFAFVLFVGSVAVLVAVSLATGAPKSDTIRGLTVDTISAGTRAASQDGRRRDIILSVLLVLIVAAVWIYFSPLVFG